MCSHMSVWIKIRGHSFVVFSGVLANLERREMSLYEVPMLLFLFDFGMGMMLTNIHMCGMLCVYMSYTNVYDCVR